MQSIFWYISDMKNYSNNKLLVINLWWWNCKVYKVLFYPTWLATVRDNNSNIL